MSPALESALRALLQQGLDQGRFSAAAVGVHDANDEEFTVLAGRHASHSDAALVSVRSQFDLASLTKPLATATLLQLAEEEGRVDLDAPVGPWIPELSGSSYADVRISELARHESGLPSWSPLASLEGGLKAWLPQIARLAPATPRGQTLYSDLGYLILGELLERLHGVNLDALFSDRVVGGDLQSTIGFHADAASSIATEQGNDFEMKLAGNSDFPRRVTIAAGEVHDTHAWALGGVAGHAGLFGTLSAVIELGRRLLPGGPLAAERRSLERRFGHGGQAPRTFGWQRARDSVAVREILSERAIGHLGFTGTSLWLEPEVGQVFVLLTNRIHPRVSEVDFQPFRREVHRLLVPGG
ncbi:MAG: beta-lactamase family protein [Acidobacteriota bacterium]|nr:beta-lactamase family protein [Acidobacteriota bacterium]